MAEKSSMLMDSVSATAGNFNYPPGGFLRIRKGRSFIEPLVGRVPIFHNYRFINGQPVGSTRRCIGDIEFLKNRVGYVMGDERSVLCSEHLALGSRATASERSEFLQKRLRLLRRIQNEQHMLTGKAKNAWHSKLLKVPTMTTPSRLASPASTISPGSPVPILTPIASPPPTTYIPALTEARCYDRLLAASMVRLNKNQEKRVFSQRASLGKLDRAKLFFDQFEHHDYHLVRAAKEQLFRSQQTDLERERRRRERRRFKQMQFSKGSEDTLSMDTEYLFTVPYVTIKKTSLTDREKKKNGKEARKQSMKKRQGLAGKKPAIRRSSSASSKKKSSSLMGPWSRMYLAAARKSLQEISSPTSKGISIPNLLAIEDSESGEES